MASSSKKVDEELTSKGTHNDPDDVFENLLKGPGVDAMDLDDYAEDEGEDDAYDPLWEEEDAVEDDEESEYEDDEITQLLDSTREARSRLKTGDLDELAKDFEEFEDNLIHTVGIGKLKHGKKKRITAGESRLPPEAKEMLGKANALYISRDYGKAIDCLQEVITKFSNIHQAWNTLGLIHEEIGNTERSLQLRMVAAHMNQNDASLWKELGVKSIESGATKQAIYCFTKALNVDPTDVDTLWDRSFLYKKMDRSDDAIDGFKQILTITPHHFKVINELAQLYRVKGLINEAISLYEDAVEYHTKNITNTDMDEEEDEEHANKLGFVEINMLSELYLIQNDYRQSLDCLRQGIRHVQHRQNETHWDPDTDEEFFEGTNPDDESLNRADFPIEMRVRMGICRLYLGDYRIAMEHFKYLLKYPASAYPDLYQDVAYAYMDKRLYDPALNVFQKIIDNSEEVEVDILIRTADCYHAVGELDTASMFYANVLEEQSENLDVMLSLATVYEEQGQEERALELVDFVMKKNREKRREQKKNEANKEEEASDDKKKNKHASIFDESGNPISKTEYYKRLRDQRRRAEDEKEQQTVAAFSKLHDLEKTISDGIVGMDRTVMREYMKIAQSLYLEFIETRSLYSIFRRTMHTGFYSMRKNTNHKGSRVREAQEMAKRLRDRLRTSDEQAEPEEIEEELDEEEQRLKEEEEEEARIVAANQFRLISFDRWLEVFISYGYMLAQSRPAEKAYDMLNRVAEVRDFSNDPSKRFSLKLALLGCALINNNMKVLHDTMRSLINGSKFKTDIYRLHSAIWKGGHHGAVYFASRSSHKLMLRHIRFIDAIASRRNGEEEGFLKKLSEAINAEEIDPTAIEELNLETFFKASKKNWRQIEDLEAKREVPEQVHPVLLSIFGQQMTITRNYIAGCLFLMRSQAIYGNDPLNLLTLGVSFLQRAMNRKTSNRHQQITQGFLFLQRYYRLRNKNQEAEYNLGRAFHHLGLTHLAIPHYERVLVMPSQANEGKIPEKSLENIYEFDEDAEYDFGDVDDTSLVRDAAYNLHIIYLTSGAFNLAQIVLRKYITV
ncbi:hypothetical protein BX666DRAFT_1971268 [Dichotomocladium elegans]|nr:hypothetical protein BX666DRAFT_1971268 [Dichotomocladium elegans]